MATQFRCEAYTDLHRQTHDMEWTALYDKCTEQYHYEYYHIFRCGAHVQIAEVIDGFALTGTHFSRMWSEGAKS